MSEEAIGEADEEVEEILAASAAMPDALGEMSLDASMVLEQIEQQVQQAQPILSFEAVNTQTKAHLPLQHPPLQQFNPAPNPPLGLNNHHPSCSPCSL